MTRGSLDRGAGFMLDQVGVGRSIRLFLADGSPHGLVVAEIGNWSGKVLAASRSRVPDLLRRSEVGRTGVYVLLGADPDRPGGLLAYIGEADDVAARLRHHLRSEAKDFFERLAVIVSSADALTKGHVRYLESQLIRLVREAGSVALTNDTHPDFQRLPEADRADMDFFVAQVVTILPLLG
ncbi:MAG: GIY-YIG nuclease family protein, partial [Rhodococcus sp.]|nr:GIY-YIG nuclease family protein [Rhodococcus sp. (in: high G+C Gram-positive bacteria)]